MRYTSSAATVVVLFVALAGCSSSGADKASNKYEQTWPEGYTETTCGDWQDEMTPPQQWTAAADMLTGARNKGDGGEGLPPDSLVDTFRDGVTTACVEPTLRLDEVGAMLYLTERERFAP